MAVQVVEWLGPHMETAGLRRNKGRRLALRETGGPPQPEGEEKAGAALVIIPSGRHCADRREVGRERTHNPSFQSGAFFTNFCGLPAPCPPGVAEAACPSGNVSQLR